MLEVEVHHQLREFLRQQSLPLWTHHLTMARLVSRALRLQRSALIQTGSTSYNYIYSYLTPALLSEQPLILVISPKTKKRLLEQDIPQLQQWLGTNKQIVVGKDGMASENFQGLLILSSQEWLSDRLNKTSQFPCHLPILLDQGEKLADYTKDFLTLILRPEDWENLKNDFRDFISEIRNIQIKLTQSLFSHPSNPYDCYLLDQEEMDILSLVTTILSPLPTPFASFLQDKDRENSLYWAEIKRKKGYFTLYRSPIDISSFLHPLWSSQPFVLMGGFLDMTKEALSYKRSIGLEHLDLLSLKFSPNRQNEAIDLYIPEKLPLPNTPEFQGVLKVQLDQLLSRYQSSQQLIVIIIEDCPLQAQMGAYLASQWGSRVQVNREGITPTSILICGWDFWEQQQETLPSPGLLIMATLPLPSLENPLVAGQVAYYKKKKQDWFRDYLLPTGLKRLQRAIIPLREHQGLVALLDNRVNLRSYGLVILAALEPYARVNYLS